MRRKKHTYFRGFILWRMASTNQSTSSVQEPVFHMCDASEFAAATVDGGFYYSPTFKDDKFIHATADPQFLLEAGNHFYKVISAVKISLFSSRESPNYFTTFRLIQWTFTLQLFLSISCNGLCSVSSGFVRPRHAE